MELLWSKQMAASAQRLPQEVPNVISDSFSQLAVHCRDRVPDLHARTNVITPQKSFPLIRVAPWLRGNK